jgi:hypothetical protein
MNFCFYTALIIIGCAQLFLSSSAEPQKCFVGDKPDNIKLQHCGRDEHACVSETFVKNGAENVVEKWCAPSCASVRWRVGMWMSPDEKLWVGQEANMTNRLGEQFGNMRLVCCEGDGCNENTTFFGDAWPDSSPVMPGIQCHGGKIYRDKTLMRQGFTDIRQCLPNQRACTSEALIEGRVDKGCAYSCASLLRLYKLTEDRRPAHLTLNYTDQAGTHWSEFTENNGALWLRLACCEGDLCNAETVFKEDPQPS